jgi:hypothetical protein
MAEEALPTHVAASPVYSEPPITAVHPVREKPEEPVSPETAEEQPESRARGMLRQAIQKVMEEIEQHEVEAKQHLQQAAQLRKELRESIAFLQAQGAKAIPSGHAGSAGPSTTEKAKEGAAASRHPRAGTKKKHAARRAKGE